MPGTLVREILQEGNVQQRHKKNGSVEMLKKPER
jgi:hypothetical protein